ncbi:MAG TPA: threonine/serine exporter family protein, partial [Spirochaetia bacterium]|nr:threonine/serine exporter family protein [Spirochaetia bacterium]
DLYAGRAEFHQAAAGLDALERLSGYPAAVTLAGAAAAAGFFTLLYGGAWNDALVAAPVGALLSRLTRILSRHGISDFFTNITGGALAALACLAAGLAGWASGPDTAIIGSIMLLVPGVAITSAIRDTIAGDLVAGVARGADAFISAAGISIGAGAAFGLWRLAGLGAL